MTKNQQGREKYVESCEVMVEIPSEGIGTTNNR
jgi:hypothetical protein